MSNITQPRPILWELGVTLMTVGGKFGKKVFLGAWVIIMLGQIMPTET